MLFCRFQIEDVDEPDHRDHQLSIGAGQADLTVHSFGYNTAEAVPMTVYYRDSGEDEGKARPSLDNLRKAEIKQQPEPTQVIHTTHPLALSKRPTPSFSITEMISCWKTWENWEVSSFLEFWLYNNFVPCQEIWQDFPGV